MKTFQYSGDSYQLVIDLLKSLRIPSHQASVDIYTHDTGYPGLSLPITKVGLQTLDDKELENLVCKIFQKMGFE